MDRGAWWDIVQRVANIRLINFQSIYNSLMFSAFTMLCNHHLYLVPKYFPLPPKETSYLLRSNSRASSPSLLQILNLLSVSMDFPILDISYEWNHTVCDSLYPTSYTWHLFWRFIHSQQMSALHSFLALYRHATFCLSAHLLMDIWVASTFWLF